MTTPKRFLGLGEVAELLAVTKRTALRYSDRSDFPQPVGVVGRGRVWDSAAVEAWAARTLPLPRDPRRKADR